MLATENRERYDGARRENNLDLFLNTHERRVGKTSPSCYQSNLQSNLQYELAHPLGWPFPLMTLLAS